MYEKLGKTEATSSEVTMMKPQRTQRGDAEDTKKLLIHHLSPLWASALALCGFSGVHEFAGTCTESPAFGLDTRDHRREGARREPEDL